jgi:hypothetical protein
MNLIKSLSQPKSSVLDIKPGALVQLKEDVEGLSTIKEILTDVEGAVRVHPPLNGYQYWRLEELEATEVFEAKLSTDRIFMVSVPATVFNGRHYEFGSTPIKVMASSADEAARLINDNRDDVLRFLGTRRVQPSGKPLLDPKCDAKKCVFFKDTYYTKSYPAKSSRDVLTRHGGFKMVKIQEQVETSLLKRAQLDEGTWVVKNKDGKEKRFKDTDSPEALAWKNSSAAPKKKAEKYSDEWWEAQRATGKHDGKMPYTAIDQAELEFGVLADLVNPKGYEINDFYITSKGDMMIDGTTVAVATVRMTYEYDMKELGYTDADIERSGAQDGRGLESMYLKVRRDRANPNKIVLVGEF